MEALKIICKSLFLPNSLTSGILDRTLEEYKSGAVRQRNSVTFASDFCAPGNPGRAGNARAGRLR